MYPVTPWTNPGYWVMSVKKKEKLDNTEIATLSYPWGFLSISPSTSNLVYDQTAYNSSLVIFIHASIIRVATVNYPPH